MFNQRVTALATQDFTFHINLGPTSPLTITGARSTATRAKQLSGLVSTIAHLLPEQIEMHVSDHDLGSWILGDDQREMAMSRIRTGLKEDGTGLNSIRHLSANELKRLENRNRNGHTGWFVSKRTSGRLVMSIKLNRLLPTPFVLAACSLLVQKILQLEAGPENWKIEYEKWTVSLLFRNHPNRLSFNKSNRRLISVKTPNFKNFTEPCLGISPERPSFDRSLCYRNSLEITNSCFLPWKLSKT